MTGIKDKISRLEATLIAYNVPAVKHFNPGLSREHILEVFSANKINPDPGLIALYEWHNGTSLADPSIKFKQRIILPNGIFFSLEDMIRVKKDMLEWAPIMSNIADYWPVFGSIEADYYIMHNSTGEILYLAPLAMIYAEEVEFNTLDDLFDCASTCFENGSFEVDPQQGTIVNYKRYEQTRLNINNLRHHS